MRNINANFQGREDAFTTQNLASKNQRCVRVCGLRSKDLKDLKGIGPAFNTWPTGKHPQRVLPIPGKPMHFMKLSLKRPSSDHTNETMIYL